MDSFCRICNMGLNPLQRKREACEKCFEENTIYYCKQGAQINLNLSGCIKDHVTRWVSYHAANVRRETNGNGSLGRNSLDNKSSMTCRVDILYFVCMCTYITQIYVSIFSTNTFTFHFQVHYHNKYTIMHVSALWLRYAPKLKSVLPLSHATPFKLVS